jgi:hypothetical protein
MHKIDRDLIMNARATDVAQAAMTITDRVQHLQPGSRVLGAAAFFLMACDRYGVDAKDAFTAVTNLMTTKEGQRDEFAATKMYLENELR